MKHELTIHPSKRTESPSSQEQSQSNTVELLDCGIIRSSYTHVRVNRVSVPAQLRYLALPPPIVGHNYLAVSEAKLFKLGDRFKNNLFRTFQAFKGNSVDFLIGVFRHWSRDPAF